MFLFDPAAARDWSVIEGEVRRLCDRVGAELLVCVKFDERKLAYEIAKRRRGTYVLTYFDAPPQRIPDLERDVRLSELVLRALILRADNLTEERLAELRAHPPQVPLAPSGGEGRRHEEERRAAEPPAAGGESPALTEGQDQTAAVGTAEVPERFELPADDE